MNIFYILLILMGFMGSAAAEVDNKPILRLNTQMHTAPISRMSIDAQQRFLVTGSDDKTARVWDLQTGDLLQVLRPPIGNDNEGKIYAVAISPDGETIAVSGWTSKTGFNESIYLFKRNGELINKISGLPNIILHLIYSPDGQFLVACLDGNNGIRIYKDNQLVSEGKNYSANSGVAGADFDAHGRLVTSSYDGKIRLYDKNFQLIQSVNPSGGKQPYTVRFNPNGDKIAVGFVDSTNVQVLSGTDLKPLYGVDTQGISNGNLSSVAWSVDGETLLAGKGGIGWFFLFSWSETGKGQRSQWVAAQNSIMDIQPLPNGSIVIASQDPLWGVFKPNGEKILQQKHNIADFRAGEILVSNQGDSIQFGYEPRNKKPAQFDLKNRELNSPTKQNKLSKPRTEGLKITDWNGKTNPKLNDKLLIEPNEMSRSLAIAPDNKKFVLGTDWYLRFFDQNGKEYIEPKPTPATTWAVNIPKNGKMVVAAFGDGTIRWYRLSDGVELLAFFPHNDGKRWVLWTPSGYYAASAGAEELIGWHVNNGSDRAASFFNIGQFRDHFYRPDIIDLILEKRDENQAVEKANKQKGIRTRGAQELLPPVARILSPQDNTGFDTNRIKLRFEIEPKTPDPITEFTVYWDERPHETYKLKPREDSTAWIEEQSIPVPLQNVTVKISVKNKKGRVSHPNDAKINLIWKGSTETNKPRLNLLAVGVNEFSKEPEIQKLLYPSVDTQQFIEFFKDQKQLYQINTPTLLNQSPTKAQILSALEEFTTSSSATNSMNVNMIFLAGHAENDPKTGEYHFLPSDFERKHFSSTALSREELKRYFDNVKGKLLVFVDTCHAGNIGERTRGDAGEFTKVINELISAESGIIVFAASTKVQQAIENDKWGNGAFTKALMEAFNGKAADTNNDGKVDINEIKAFVDNRVKDLTKGRQTPVIIAPQGISNYPIAIVK
jgi:WD40 repeat protein